MTSSPTYPRPGPAPEDERLDRTASLPGSFPSTASDSTSVTGREDRESLYSRLLLTPLTFFSFLVSLFLVERLHAPRQRHAHGKPAGMCEREVVRREVLDAWTVRPAVTAGLVVLGGVVVGVGVMGVWWWVWWGGFGAWGVRFG
ncbi:MAG: hypothetical protein M1813_006598 [Trichoglossum hirsutum]|nr:MAG: hypothetical protein M1813_006598 [Trichoglossum hirsutum]